MHMPDMNYLLREPVRTGIITAFSALSTAAALNLGIGFVLGEANTLGTAGFMLALSSSGIAGLVSSIVMARVVAKDQRVLEMITALSNGDMSKIAHMDLDNLSLTQTALRKLADRELFSESELARQSKDAATRRKQLEDAVDAFPDAVCVYSADGLLVMANTTFIAQCNNAGAVIALGMSRGDVLSAMSKAPRENLPINERQTWINYHEGLRQDALASGTPIRFTQHGSVVSDIRVVRTHDEKQIEIIRDISATIELEDKAMRAQREASAAESIKQVTLSRLSHTIRTPMTGVLAATELLSETQLDQRQRERLDIIRRSTSTLLGVVQDIIDIAATGPEKEVLPKGSASAQTRSALVLKPNEIERTQKIDELIAEGFEVGIVESIEILVEALVVLDGRNRSPETVYVLDTEAMDAALHAFDCANLQTRPEIQVIPADTAPVLQSIAPNQFTFDSLDILIAESDEINQIAFANALSKSDLKFQICSKGKDAIEVATARNPKLLLIDISLSDLDGFETTKSLRKQLNSKTKIGPIVAMTSHFVQGDKSKCLDNGMDGYVLKPTVGDELIRLAQHWLNLEPVKMAS